jgi:hypothetical protein
VLIAEREAARARENERMRQEEMIRHEAAARAADKAQRNKINTEIINYLHSGGIGYDDAQKMVELVAMGIVPHIKIEY